MAPQAGKRRNASGSNLLSEPLEEGLPESATDIPKPHAVSSQARPTTVPTAPAAASSDAASFDWLMMQGPLLKTEGWNMLLLSTLYLMQGVPLGLTMGSM